MLTLPGATGTTYSVPMHDAPICGVLVVVGLSVGVRVLTGVFVGAVVHVARGVRVGAPGCGVGVRVGALSGSRIQMQAS